MGKEEVKRREENEVNMSTRNQSKEKDGDVMKKRKKIKKKLTYRVPPHKVCISMHREMTR